MNKIRNITILAVFAVICLQIIWVHRLYQSYLVEQKFTTEKSFTAAIEKELGIRDKMEGRPFVTLKSKKFMTSEEMANYKGDTVMLNAPRQTGVADSFFGILMQIKQDLLMSRNLPLNLTVLDSLFVVEFTANFPHRILLYDSGKKILDTTGILHPNQSWNVETELIPIGTKGLQFLQLKMNVPLSGFIREMIFILTDSVLLILIALYGLCYQFIVIRRKEALLQRRETSVNGIIHDLKAPLNGVLMLLEWLQKGEANESKRQLMETGKGNVQALVRDIESLLVTARGDRKKIVLDKTEVNLCALVGKVKQELEMLYREKTPIIAIEDKLPAGYAVQGDAYYLGNVFKNLIENALKYSEDGVKITVTVWLEGKSVRVSVADNGWGIAKPHQKKIFTQFYQVERENRKNSGYGVGLAYVKYIIQAHGGTLRLESSEHVGSNFYFSLPL